MKKLLVVILIVVLGACAPTPTPEIIVVTATPKPTAALTPTPKPPVEIQIMICGYGGQFGFITMSGTATNNTSRPITFLKMAVALIKNDRIVRTDEIYLTNATGKNLGILYGLDYITKAEPLLSGETLIWRIQYPLDKLTQPFECEASATRIW